MENARRLRIATALLDERVLLAAQQYRNNDNNNNNNNNNTIDLTMTTDDDDESDPDDAALTEQRKVCVAILYIIAALTIPFEVMLLVNTVQGFRNCRRIVDGGASSTTIDSCKSDLYSGLLMFVFLAFILLGCLLHCAVVSNLSLLHRWKARVPTEALAAVPDAVMARADNSGRGIVTGSDEEDGIITTVTGRLADIEDFRIDFSDPQRVRI
jgi:hypothetical protein